MRYLEFDPERNEDEYGIIVTGVARSRKPFSVDEILSLSNIFKKFETIGQRRMESNGAVYELKQKGTVALEDAEYNLVHEALKQTPWSPSHVHEVAKGLQLFLDAPKHEPVKAKALVDDQR